MIAAIGTDGLRPVVWGVGETEDEALADAISQGEPTWEAEGRAFCVITQLMATQIDQGVIGCGNLGINVIIDRYGRIVRAALETS